MRLRSRLPIVRSHWQTSSASTARRARSATAARRAWTSETLLELDDIREAILLATQAGQGREVAILHNNLGVSLWAYDGPQAALAELDTGDRVCHRPRTHRDGRLDDRKHAQPAALTPASSTRRSPSRPRSPSASTTTRPPSSRCEASRRASTRLRGHPTHAADYLGLAGNHHSRHRRREMPGRSVWEQPPSPTPRSETPPTQPTLLTRTRSEPQTPATTPSTPRSSPRSSGPRSRLDQPGIAQQPHRPTTSPARPTPTTPSPPPPPRSPKHAATTRPPRTATLTPPSAGNSSASSPNTPTRSKATAAASSPSATRTKLRQSSTRHAHSSTSSVRHRHSPRPTHSSNKPPRSAPKPAGDGTWRGPGSNQRHRDFQFPERSSVSLGASGEMRDLPGSRLLALRWFSVGLGDTRMTLRGPMAVSQGEVVDSPGDDLRGVWRGESGSGEVLPGVWCAVGSACADGGEGAQGSD